MTDLFDYVCPECGEDGQLDTLGSGEPDDAVWCENCGWDGTLGDLVEE